MVIEYYYVRANNILMASKLVNAGIADHNTFDPKLLTKLCKEYRKGSSEDEAIKLVLEKAIDIPNLNDSKLVDETPLMSYVASKVLEAWGIK